MPAPHAFTETDYPDHRTEESRAAERRATEAQVAGLGRLREAGKLLSVVQHLEQRRAADPRRTRFETVRTGRGTPVLVAAGSVVTREPPTGDPGATGRGPGAGRRSRRRDVARGPGDRRTISQIVDELRGGRDDVAFDHILPLAGHIKGGGGPEPSTGARPFGEVEFPRHRPSPVIAVLDTGVSAEQRGDRFLAMPVDARDVDPLDELGPHGFLDVAAGHGAFVAGIVQQVAPAADLRIHRVVDSDGITTDSELAELVSTAIAKGATILNLSLGTATVDGEAPPAVTEVVGQHPDVLFVCAAGNGGSDEPIWPAALAATHPNVVSVAALDAAGEPAAWSSRGAATFSTVGEGVVSTYVEGREDGAVVGDPVPDRYGPSAWALWTGTSFAAPQITGALARIIMSSETDLSPAQAVAVLRARGAAPAEPDGYGTRLRILPGT